MPSPTLGAGPAARTVYLGDCRFEPADGRLWRGDQELPLRPKAAEVLAQLVRRAGDVVTKRELLETVWPAGYVEEGVLAVCVNELRRVLGDNRAAPRYIGTVHRRGYRLLVEPSAFAPRNPSGSSLFCGRESELSALWERWAHARAGHCTVVFVTAEAGVGKTALLEHFVSSGSGRGGWLAGFGRSVQLSGGSEPYQPVLDALDHLCRGPAGAVVVDVLERTAPHWLAQLPGRWELPTEPSSLRAGAMLREFAAAVLELTTQRPLLLTFEDLHHVDRPTTELISYLAHLQGSARLMVIGSYRPDEAVGPDHPLSSVVRDLAAHGLCRQLALQALTPDGTAACVRALLAPRVPSPALVRDIHVRTEGNPLFTTALCRHLAERGLLVDTNTGTRAVDRLAALGVPGEVRAMLELRVGALAADSRRLLEVASVAGRAFTGAEVAAGLAIDSPAGQVEDRCDSLADTGTLVRHAGSTEWPDGTVTARYEFAHEMYRDVLRDGVGSARATRTHRAIGARLAAGSAVGGEFAAEIAAHLALGGQPAAAAGHVVLAARVALSRSAYPEAHECVRRGFELLDQVPPGPERVRLELRLRMAQVVAFGAVWAWREPAARAACVRLHELAVEQGDTVAAVAGLLGSHNVAMMSGDPAGRGDSAAQLEALAERTGDPAAMLMTHLLQTYLASRVGDCAAMWSHAQEMVRLHRPEAYADLAIIVGEDPTIAGHELGAVALWQLGRADQAQAHVRQALDLARDRSVPADLARALWFAGIVHLLCGDAARVQKFADELLRICAQHDLALWRAGGNVLGGWATARLGHPDAGLAQVREGMAGWGAFARLGTAFHATIAGGLLLAEGDVDEGLVVVQAGLVAVTGDGECQCEPELHRLYGELLVLAGKSEHGRQELVTALEVGAARGALGWQLRAATSLAGVPGAGLEGLAALRDVLDSLTEGEDTTDVRTARELLRDDG